MNHSKSLSIFVTLSIVFGFVGGLLGGKYIIADWTPLQEGGTVVTEENIYIEHSDMIDAVEKISPAVVSVSVFDDIGIVDSSFRLSYQEAEISSGTGFIVSSDGLILTNKHVVNDKDSGYLVLFDDGAEYSAELVSTDPYDDVAVLKINVPEGEEVMFSTVKFGDSSELKVGQRVFAVGNALAEFGNTVTFGIVSAIGREIVAHNDFGSVVENLSGLIQTDAAINLGNSGGPLVNMKGEVIGMNVATVEGGSGIGFAIPVNDLKPILKSVEEYGEIVRPVLGVRFVMLTEDQANEISADIKNGALLIADHVAGIEAVFPGGAADEAGLKANDVIISVNEELVNLDKPLHKVVRQYVPGDSLKMKVFRDGKIIEIELVLKSSKDLE